MKRTFTLIALATALASAKGTTVTITCQNTPSHFLPVTVNAIVGDTIKWVWVAGTHVVGPINSSYIPNGAAMFNAPIDVNNTSFKYVVTVAGNYHYVCHPATPHGEDGYIVVSASSGISSINNTSASIAYPNPFYDRFTIETPRGDLISVFNMLGSKVKVVPVPKGQFSVEIDAAALSSGLYFYSISSEGTIVETKKILKR